MNNALRSYDRFLNRVDTMSDRQRYAMLKWTMFSIFSGVLGLVIPCLIMMPILLGTTTLSAGWPLIIGAAFFFIIFFPMGTFVFHVYHKDEIKALHEQFHRTHGGEETMVPARDINPEWEQLQADSQQEGQRVLSLRRRSKNRLTDQ